jgi:hypothetical protein
MTENAHLPQEDYLYGLASSGEPDEAEGFSLYAARATGLFKSTNGENWHLATESLQFDQSYSATAVAVTKEPDSQTVIFLGLAGGVLYSSNDGATWLAGSLPQPPPVISCFSISPNFARDGIILAGTLEDGVMRSADGGRRWVLWNFGLLDLGVMSLAISPNFTHDETVFAGTESGLFRSTNGGRAWREVEMPAGFDPVMCLALAPDFNHERSSLNGENAQAGASPFRWTIYAGTESQGLYRSADRGKSWIRLGQEILEGTVQMVLLAPTFPEKQALLAVVGGRIFYSPDAGDHWREIWSESTVEKPATALLTPQGIESGKPAWIGMADGGVRKLTFPEWV